ncbi:MAG: hypothetical protein O2968_14645 [Acidobacteria bacterium]|nr:hypothetical protein [Acidobacteriota bacterium]
MTPRRHILALLLLAVAGLACASRGRLVKAGDSPQAELVASMKDFERQAGFEESANFARHSSRLHVDYRCYYTGKLELPTDYSKLKLRRGTPAGCALNEEKHDVFFYPLEAAASGHTPLTPSLSKASVERMLVVVPHEDFHNDSRIEDWPATIREAASTLVGFLSAAEFAKEHYGESSREYLRLQREPEIFLGKAKLINRYAELVAVLYEARRAGAISRSTALERKRELFEQLSGECRALPDARSFNKCPSASNNAGLAFDRTYTKHYPLLHSVYLRSGKDLKSTMAQLRTPPNKRWSERSAIAHLEALAAPSPPPLR